MKKVFILILMFQIIMILLKFTLFNEWNIILVLLPLISFIFLSAVFMIIGFLILIKCKIMMRR